MKIKPLALNTKYDPENQCFGLFLILAPSTEMLVFTTFLHRRDEYESMGVVLNHPQGS